MYLKDTIAAIATASGNAGIGIIRISGVDALKVAKELTKKTPEPRKISYAHFYDGADEVIDSGIILCFIAPHSFTGEDVIEVQAHGGSIVLQTILQRLLQLGARLAEAGEFTKRAYLNERIDLLQSEAIHNLITAKTSSAVKAARKSLSGSFSRDINEIQQELTKIRIHVEASLDFPDEQDATSIEHELTIKNLQALQDKLRYYIKQAQQGELLTKGIDLAIVGRPNVGKSSLLNLLARNEVAIVTDQPGTTRDLVKKTINLNGVPVNVIDTAGIRKTQEKVEKLGIERTYQVIENTEVILLVVNALDGITKADKTILKELKRLHINSSNTQPNLIVVCNKIDLVKNKFTLNKDKIEDYAVVYISALLGQGLDELTNAVCEAIGLNNDEDSSSLTLRTQQIQQLQLTASAIDKSVQLNEPELLAEELRLAQEHLNKVLAKFTSDDLLGEIFAKFCMGK